MPSTLRTSFAAAGLLACAGSLLAAPAFARDAQWVVVQQAPAVVAPAPVYGRDGDRYDQGGWRHDTWRRDNWHDARHEGTRRDGRAPDIVDLTPLPGERVGERYRMTVSARFNDDASGIDPASVRLRIDGQDVTGAARVGDDEVRLRDNLFPGRHVAEVIVRDRAGNTARRSWQFDVADRGGRGWREGDGGGYRRSGW